MVESTEEEMDEDDRYWQDVITTMEAWQKYRYSFVDNITRSNMEVIALVKILRVRDGGNNIWIEPREVFKGSLSPNQIIGAIQPESRSMTDWFSSGETCLIFSRQSPLAKVIAAADAARMPLVMRGDTVYAACFAIQIMFPDDVPILTLENDERLILSDPSGQTDGKPEQNILVKKGERLVDWVSLKKTIVDAVARQ